MPRKRTFAEVEASEPLQESKKPGLVQKIRNMWEFASTMQYIFLFGKVMKIDEDFDIEDFENECLKPGYSEKLEEIGLQLLRFLSSNRGLNLDNWDEYVRRQYLSKSPDKSHPYGDQQEPNRFRDFDIFTRIRVLHQMTNWTFTNPDRIRSAFPDAKESDQLDWRMAVFGYDEEDREYYVLDDSRLYRRTSPDLPPAPKAKPKATSQKARAARRRASKRRKLDDTESQTETHDEENASETGEKSVEELRDSSELDTFGGFVWECIAITLEDFQNFIGGLRTSIKNYPNERQMRDRLIEEVLPTIQELADKQRRKQERRERELMMMERMVGAKRSSRLAGKQEREKREHEEAEIARKRAHDLAAAHREQQKQEQMEQERQSRMMTREQRIKDREYKRILMEEELAREAEEQKRIEEGEKRGSERHIKERIEKYKKELEDLGNDDEWTFDCSGCGVHGKNIDDGSHSIACEKCNVWQHSKCLGISKAAAEKDDFSFVCGDCRRREKEEARRKEEEARRKEEEANQPKITLKFRSGQSSSPPQQSAEPAGLHQAGFIQKVDIPQNPHVSHATSAPVVNGHDSSQNPVKHVLSSPSSQPHTNGLSQPYHRPQQSPPSRPMGQPPRHAQQAQNVPDRNNSNPSQPGPARNGLQMTPQHNSQHPVYVNGTGLQQQLPPNGTSQAVSSSEIQFTPRPGSAQSQHHATPVAGRIPSPIVNRPTMSPTQGNPDVGPIAGFPQDQSSNFRSTAFSSRIDRVNGQTNGTLRANGSQSPPARVSQTPNPQLLSGLSPVKQRSPPPFPPASSSLSASFNANSSSSNAIQPPQQLSRSISGTPIFPPAEKLAPSPEHLNREPVPTPSKQPTPGPTPNASFDVGQSFAQQTPTHGGR